MPLTETIADAIAWSLIVGTVLCAISLAATAKNNTGKPVKRKTRPFVEMPE